MLARAADPLEDLAGLDEKGGSSRGEFDHLAVASQQLRPQLLFQRLDGRAQRRLRNGKPICRTVEMQLFREHAEILQVVQLHGRVPTDVDDPKKAIKFILQ
jgi:hypothetical protein